MIFNGFDRYIKLIRYFLVGESFDTAERKHEPAFFRQAVYTLVYFLLKIFDGHGILCLILLRHGPHSGRYPLTSKL